MHGSKYLSGSPIKSVAEIRLDSILEWHDSVREGVVEKLKEDGVKTLRVLSREEKIQLYNNLRTIASAYKLIGNYHEWDRHLEAADSIRRKFRLRMKIKK